MSTISYNNLEEGSSDNKVIPQMSQNEQHINKNIGFYVDQITYRMCNTLPMLIITAMTIFNVYYMFNYRKCSGISMYLLADSALGFTYTVIYNTTNRYFGQQTYRDVSNLFYIDLSELNYKVAWAFLHIVINIAGAIIYNSTREYNCIISKYPDNITNYNTFIQISLPIKFILYLFIMALPKILSNISIYNM